MKKYLAIGLIGIFFLTACGVVSPKDSNVQAGEPVPQEENTSMSLETSSTAVKSNTVPAPTTIFQKAVATHDPEECKKIPEDAQRQNCINIVTELKARDKGPTTSSN